MCAVQRLFLKVAIASVSFNPFIVSGCNIATLLLTLCYGVDVEIQSIILTLLPFKWLRD